MTYEQNIHERVWAVYQAYKTPAALMFHIPNGERRGARTAAKLARMGVVAGVPDFECMAEGRVFFLELKRPKGRLSKVQLEFIKAAALHTIPTYTAWSIEGAVAVLQRHGVLRADIKFSSDGQSDRWAQGGSEAPASGPFNQITSCGAVTDAGVA